MTTMAAVDLGAQSGRVALGRVRRRAARRRPRSTASRTCRSQRAGRCTGTSLRLYAEVLDGLRAAGARGRDRLHRGRLLGASTSGSSTAAAACAEPRALPRHRRRGGRRACSRECRRASSTSAPASSCCRSTRSSSWPRWPPRAIRRSTPPSTLLLIPDLLHYWLCGARVAEWTNATTTQCFDPRAGGWAATCSSASRSRAAASRRSSSRDDPRPADAPVTAADIGCTPTSSRSPPTAPPRRRGRPVPRRRLRVHQRRHLVTRRCRDRRAAIADRTFAGNLTNEGGVDGTFRLLKNVAGLWLLARVPPPPGRAPGKRPHVRESLSRSLRSRRRFTSFVDPDDPSFATPGDMPARIRAFCAATGQQQPGTARRRSRAASSRASR